MKEHSLFLMTKPLNQAVHRRGTNSFRVTCLHTGNSCDEGRINITCEPCRRGQLENSERHLMGHKALKEVQLK